MDDASWKVGRIVQDQLTFRLFRPCERSEEIQCSAPSEAWALLDCFAASQRRREASGRPEHAVQIRLRDAVDLQDLQPALIAGDDADRAATDLQRLGDQRDQRPVGRALDRRCGDAGLR
ncbi:hypothetical protein SR39_14805 [Methylobacterium radiotolerans]|nr:hypothetical protein SR39_14805 [Methylobacterium radiotolerans]